MAKNYKNWEKLDNTAKIFPVIANDTLTNTYRICSILNEEVDGEILQQAVDMLLPKMPAFRYRLRTGFFWYYFEENDKPAPRVVKEADYPCRFIHQNKNNYYLFRVTYYKNRINLEAFHALTDGMGIIGFIRELTYQYLRLTHPELRQKLGDGLSEETSLDREDSYKANYKKASKSVYKTKKAFLIKGEKLPFKGFGVMCAYFPVDQVKKVAKEKYGVSINEYLVAAFAYATWKSHGREVTKEKPIRVAVPVNLRPFFDSITTKNFFVMVSAEFAPERDDYTFAEVTQIIRESLRSQITKENLENIFSYNVSNEDYLVSRVVPLFVKNIAMKVVYTQAALANTTTITNIGNIGVKPEYQEYIKNFYGFLSFSKGQEMKCIISSYLKGMVMTFTSAFTDTSIQRRTFSQLAEDGIDVEIETNGVYYE